MGRLFLAFIFGAVLLFAQSDELNTTLQEQEQETPLYQQKVLYLSYVDVPKRVIKGEIFSLTIKTLSVIQDFTDINYTFNGAKGIKILNDALPYREAAQHGFFDTFYFKALSSNIQLPSITATLKSDLNITYPSTTLPPKHIEAIALNPKEDFCNIVAKSLSIEHYKTSSYDATHNIVVFSITAKQTSLKDFHLKGVNAQGFESLTDTIESSKMIYYAVIDKKQENLPFSYFSTIKNDYIKLNIPIVVQEDSVATQSDLKPKDNSKKRLKLFIAVGVIIFGVVMLLWRRRYIYIVMILLPTLYTAYLLIPEDQVCIKEATKIRILPLENGTVFEITPAKLYLYKVGETKGFVKVELPNKKIGWVKNEDLCTY